MTAPVQYLTGYKPAVTGSADLSRILGLPRRPPVEPDTAEAEALIQHVTAKYSKNVPSGRCRCKAIAAEWGVLEKPCIERLNYAQAWMLHEIRINAGLVAHAAVGIGKTVVDVLGALAMPNCKVAVLLIPPTLASQLAREWELIAEHFDVPTIYIHHNVKRGKDRPKEFKKIVPGKPLLHVLPYSRLSRPESTVYLEDVLKPDTIFADECQNLASLQSVRTGRLVRYFERFGDGIRMGCWSGSLTDDEIQDYSSLSALSLKRGSPVPLDPRIADEWGLVLNPDPNGWSASEGALVALHEPHETLYEGYNRRLRETPGFVITSGASVDSAMEVRERKAPEIPDVLRPDPRAPGITLPDNRVIPAGMWPGVQSCLKLVRDTWIRPDGEQLLDVLAASRCARELACGLFLRWKFIHGESRELIDDWKAKRKLWRQELRDMLQQRRPHMDSPMLCALAAMRGWGQLPSRGQVIDLDDEGKAITAEARFDDLPAWKAQNWPAWDDIRKKVQPVTEAVRLDPYLALDAAAWAKENRGIVWYHTVAFGKWVAELSGLPLHEGGPKAAEKLAKEKGDRSIIASIKSHGTGRDGLQRLFATQLVAQPPSSAVAWEQLLGRLSRIGQDADVVYALVYRHTKELRAQLDAAMRKALYVQQTLRSKQKLHAGWME